MLWSFFPSVALFAQGPVVASLATRFSAITAVSGYEQSFGDSLLALLPAARRDRAGNVVVTLGSGAPRRLAACPIDEPGYVVGNITADGWLTLRRVGRVTSPLFDQRIEGQRVTLFGAKGPVPGVVAVRSVHLQRGRTAAGDPPFTVDDAYVDVGAASREDVRALGLELLTPVALIKRPQRYGAGGVLLAAPGATRRSACAALAAAILSNPKVTGTVVAAFTVESLQFEDVGLAALQRTAAAPFAEVTAVSLQGKYTGTPVETVSLAAADSLMRKLVSWMEAR